MVFVDATEITEPRAFSRVDLIGGAKVFDASPINERKSYESCDTRESITDFSPVRGI